ncbi:hypothetical protein C8R44DRAFT_736457 [Mycena epipterygia]|nr:hypothetical protein C8R44DRAFT_736457 [Mycena epipterygia]
MGKRKGECEVLEDLRRGMGTRKPQQKGRGQELDEYPPSMISRLSPFGRRKPRGRWGEESYAEKELVLQLRKGKGVVTHSNPNGGRSSKKHRGNRISPGRGTEREPVTSWALFREGNSSSFRPNRRYGPVEEETRLRPDVIWLLRHRVAGERHLLVSLSARPMDDDWEAGARATSERRRELRITLVTSWTRMVSLQSSFKILAPESRGHIAVIFLVLVHHDRNGIQSDENIFSEGNMEPEYGEQHITGSFLARKLQNSWNLMAFQVETLLSISGALVRPRVVPSLSGLWATSAN